MSISRQIVNWGAGLVATAVGCSLVYLGADLWAQSQKVPLLEQRLHTHEQIVESRLDRIEDRLEEVIRLLLRKREEKPE